MLPNLEFIQSRNKIKPWVIVKSQSRFPVHEMYIPVVNLCNQSIHQIYSTFARFTAKERKRINTRNLYTSIYLLKNYETYNRSARVLFYNKCLWSNIKQVSNKFKWFLIKHQDPLCGSIRIHHMDQTGSITSSPGSTTWIHQDPSHGSTRIHYMNPPGSVMWIHLDQSCGSARIYHLDSPGSIRWIHQDPSGGSTWIHHVDPPESIIRIH